MIDARLLYVAIVTAVSQVVFLPFLLNFWGSVPGTEFFLLLGLHSGFVLGQTTFLSKRAEIFFGFAVGLALTMVGLFFTPIVLLATVNIGVKVLLTMVLFSAVSLIGHSLTESLYLPSRRFQMSYGMLNVLCLASVIAVTVLLPTIGLNYAFAILGLVFLSESFRYIGEVQVKKEQWWRALKLSRPSAKTLMMGTVSGGFISVYFSLVDLTLWPTGYEFPAYLAQAFLCLALGPILIKGLQSLGLDTSSSGAIRFAALSFFGILCEFYFIQSFSQSGLLLLYKWIPEINSLLVAFFIFLPYLFIALIVPLRQEEDPRVNHLFFSSLGNLIGLVLFYWLLQGVNLSVQVALIFALSLALHLLSYKQNTQSHLYAGFLIFASVFFLTKDFDQQILIRSTRMWNIRDQIMLGMKYVDPGDFFSIGFQKRKDRELGYVVNYKKYPTRHVLGQDAYRSFMSSQREIQQALFAKPFVKPGETRVLILGLGGHQVLSKISQILLEKKEANFTIDVVDNFAPFRDVEFRNKVAALSGFHWPADRTKFYYQDVFNFVLNAGNRYDIIYWNLSSPAYRPASRLYSVEFMQAVRHLLAPGGAFFSYVEHLIVSDSIICLFRSTYPYFQFHPGMLDNSVFIGSNEPINLKTFPHPYSQIPCDGVWLPRLSKPLMGTLVYFNPQAERDKTALALRLERISRKYYFEDMTKEERNSLDESTKLYLQ